MLVRCPRRARPAGPSIPCSGGAAAVLPASGAATWGAAALVKGAYTLANASSRDARGGHNVLPTWLSHQAVPAKTGARHVTKIQALSTHAR